jgi:NAD(P)-dependent dehydrogenase (short-subunit alcohol dehydrogenase family)
MKPTDDRQSTDDPRLDGKVALMLGTSGDIGAAVTAGLASAGAEVVIGLPTPDHSNVMEALEKIDILVHTPDRPIFNRRYVGMHHDDLGEVAEKCVRGVARVCEQAGRYMARRKGGCVILIHAPEARRLWPELTGIAVKSAQLELMKLLAHQWAPEGVRINSVSPNGSVASAHGVSDAVLWLVSDAARYVTGTHIRLDSARNISVAGDWQQLFESLVVEDGDRSSPWTTQRLAQARAISSATPSSTPSNSGSSECT